MRARRRAQGTGIWRIVLGSLPAFLAMTAILVFGAVGAFGVLNSWLQDLPDYESPGAFEVAQTTRVYSADGVLLARLYLENRTVVPISSISTDLATPSSRSKTSDSTATMVSTCTPSREQPSRTSWPARSRRARRPSPSSTSATPSSSTSAPTSRLHARSGRHSSRANSRSARDKDEILELYLNAIYFGEGAYGAQAASQTFFSKNANELTLPRPRSSQVSPSSPAGSRPTPTPRVRRRRNQVLARMLANGYITADEYEEARRNTRSNSNAHPNRKTASTRRPTSWRTSRRSSSRSTTPRSCSKAGSRSTRRST
jgi:penicillin-binding protein 2D